MRKEIVLICTFLMLFFSISCNKDDPVPQINASFSVSESTIVEGTSVTFTDQSTNNPTAWSWDFEGGSPTQATQQNPTVLYENSGVYQVALVASNSGSSDDEVKPEFITVIQKLEAQFDLSDSIINQSEEVTFTDRSVGSVTNWVWTFEGGTPSTSTESNPTISYNTSGVYNVTLAISNDLDSDEINLEKRIIVLPTSGLIAHYPFSGNVNDESGNGLNGTVIGANQTADRTGTVNTAYSFDGINDRIEVPNSSLFENQRYSLSAWFKAESETGGIISMTDFDPTQNTNGYYLSILNGNLRGLSNIGTGNWVRNVDDEQVSLNTWHHVVFTYDGNTLHLYLNGIQVSSLEQPHTVNFSQKNPLQIGVYSTQSDGTWFSGSLDDIRIFDRALRVSEVEALALE